MVAVCLLISPHIWPLPILASVHCTLWNTLSLVTVDLFCGWSLVTLTKMWFIHKGPVAPSTWLFTFLLSLVPLDWRKDSVHAPRCLPSQTSVPPPRKGAGSEVHAARPLPPRPITPTQRSHNSWWLQCSQEEDPPSLHPSPFLSAYLFLTSCHFCILKRKVSTSLRNISSPAEWSIWDNRSVFY